MNFIFRVCKPFFRHNRSRTQPTVNSSNPQPDSSMLYTKFGITAKYTITQDGADTLLIEHVPNRFALVGVIISLIGIAILLYVKTEYVVYPALSLIFMMWELVSRRPIRCVFDHQTGRFHYSRGGLLGLRFRRQDITGKISKIRHLEMQRHIRRGGDTFQIVLSFQDKRFALSHDDLNFSECQKYAECIRDFLRMDIPIRAKN